MECPRGNSRSRTAQIRGKLKDELSQSRAKPLAGEGVETRRAAPTAFEGYGEGIVQTTNALAAAAKVEVVRKSAPREGVGVRVPPSAPPSPRTTDKLRIWGSEVRI